MGKQKTLSDCCKSLVEIVSLKDFNNYYGEDTTNYYRCTKCGKICDGSVLTIKMRTQCETCGNDNVLCLLHNDIWVCKKCFVQNGKDCGYSVKELNKEWVSINGKKTSKYTKN